MTIRALLVERSRVAADLANVEKGMRDSQLLVALRTITRGARGRARAEPRIDFHQYHSIKRTS